MRRSRLSDLNFMALCCVLGLFTKKMINPLANVITESLHIPGGISTGFSIMFLVVAAEVVRGGRKQRTDQKRRFGAGNQTNQVAGEYRNCCGTVIDVVYRVGERFRLDRTERMVFANALAAVMASVTANVIVFRLWGPVLLLYLCVSALSGTVYGFLGSAIAGRLKDLVE